MLDITPLQSHTFIVAISRESKKSYDALRFRGDCYSYGLLALGHVYLVIEAKLEVYDFMTLVPVVEAAGDVISDWKGRPLNLESDGRVIAAAADQLHIESLSCLQSEKQK